MNNIFLFIFLFSKHYYYHLENIKITKISIENSVIACPIDEAEVCNPLHLVKLHLTSEMKFIKCTLGFENEKVMFSNTNVQNLLKFCQFNCDNFIRAVEYEVLPKEVTKPGDTTTNSSKTKLSKTSSAFSKFFSSDKNTPAHEREDSIIFLSKNDLENLEQQKQLTTTQDNNNQQQKVSSSGKKSWFKNLRNVSTNVNQNPNGSSTSKTSSFVNLNSNSMDRYQDMSKLIQERFGTIEINERERSDLTTTTLKSSSEISYDLNDHSNKAMQKCFSLQNIELNNSIDIQQPDLVAKHQRQQMQNNSNSSKTVTTTTVVTHDDNIEKDETYVSQVHSSNDSALNSIGMSSQTKQQSSFITEKLFNEFYVKTKQYSKSSSSLHQLLHFSIPQKMNIRETRKQQQQRLEKAENDKQKNLTENINNSNENSALMHLDLPPPPSTDPPSESEEIISSDDLKIHSLRDDMSIITDDLPYCSVRDSIFHNHNHDQPRQTPTESIYAEICATPPVPSDTSEVSYKMEKPPRASNKNVSSIRISFGNDSVPTTILSSGNITLN
jgi:hypothetical protein